MARAWLVSAAAFLAFASSVDAAPRGAVTREGVQHEDGAVRVTFVERRFIGANDGPFGTRANDRWGIQWFAANVSDGPRCVRVTFTVFEGASRSDGVNHRLESGQADVLVAELRSEDDGDYEVEVNTLTWEPGRGGASDDCAVLPTSRR
jgi:hypothetical protein